MRQQRIPSEEGERVNRALKLAIAVLAVLSALVTVQAGLADDSDGSTAVPLTGETLAASEGAGTSEVGGTCNLLGSSPFTFAVTGVASGPYPGTFFEEGSFTLGPLFSVDEFMSEFTISSPAGTVTGTKELDPASMMVNFGACGMAVFGGLEAEAVQLQAPLTYIATITTPSGGSATDSGTSYVTYDETQIRNVGSGFDFVETFTSTSFSGGDDDDDDDDDDGGDD
jgi:hypothetical protein